MTTDAPSDTSAWTHHAALYDDDESFLAMALPFITDGIAAGEPVLATTTSANLDLLHAHLGADADKVDYAESAYFGRRPPQRAAAFERYWRRHEASCPPGSGRRARVLAEPIWTGRSAREVTDWKRMEAGLNVVLADTRMWMICPYDTRVVPDHIADAALRTHPVNAVGTRYEPSDMFVDPGTFARELGDDAAPGPPPDDAARVAAADLHGLRAFAKEQATAHGLEGDAAALLVTVVNETATYLGAPSAHAAIWPAGGSIVCDLRPAGSARADDDPFAGFRAPELGQPRPADGLWYARQVTDHLDLYSGPESRVARIHFPGPRAVDAH